MFRLEQNFIVLTCINFSFHQSSGSGSGSESGIQAKKSSKSKSVEGSDHNSGSNDGDDNTSIGLNGRDGIGSDNGSGTQVYTQFTQP